jgi:hypothetical protein
MSAHVYGKPNGKSILPDIDSKSNEQHDGQASASINLLDIRYLTIHVDAGAMA